MIKYTQTIPRLLPMNGSGVFDHFAGLALKGLGLVEYLMFLEGTEKDQ